MFIIDKKKKITKCLMHKCEQNKEPEMVRRKKRSDLKKEKVVIIIDLIFDYNRK